MIGKIIGGFALVVIVLIALGFVLPDKTHIEREITINAPQNEVFALVSDLGKTNSWSPWAQIDPDADYTLTGSGVGQKLSWKSDHNQVGNGSQTVTALDAPNRVDFAMTFDGMGKAKAAMELSPVGQGTNVVWSFESNMREAVPLYMKPIMTYMSYFMDGMLGPQYQTGLDNLKALAEGGA